MKKFTVAMIFLIMFFSTMTLAYAQGGDWRGGIRARIQHDQQRIERGVERGSLTRHEARNLRQELAAIETSIDRMKRDGHLNRRERERIDRYLDKLDRDISKEKRDLERRRY